MTPYRFAARLERSPFVGVPARASGRIFPLASDSDFSVMSGLPKREGLPVYLSVPEHYRLLADIVEAIGAELRVEFILTQFKAPYMVPLPDALLRAHVLLTADTAPERDRLLAQGRPFVTVEDSLLRDPCEDGLNELCITCYAPGVTEEWFRTAIAALPWLGAFGVIDRPEVEPFSLSMHYG